MRMMSYNAIRGALYGFTVGDALGAATEFMSKETIAKQYGTVTKMLGGGWLNLRPGEVTDDTEMMIAIGNALVAADGKNASGELRRLPDIFYAESCIKLANWFDSNPKDVGGRTKFVIQECKGKDYQEWWACKGAENALGNGGLLRALFPILAGMKEPAIRQGFLTHNNKETERTIAQMFYDIHSLAHGEYENNPNIKHSEPEGTAIATYINAIHWLQSTRTFKDAVLGAVNDGGDADSIAAITGALAGVKYGYNAIPADFVKALPEVIKNRLNFYVNFIVNFRKMH